MFSSLKDSITFDKLKIKSCHSIEAFFHAIFSTLFVDFVLIDSILFSRHNSVSSSSRVLDSVDSARIDVDILANNEQKRSKIRERRSANIQQRNINDKYVSKGHNNGESITRVSSKCFTFFGEKLLIQWVRAYFWSAANCANFTNTEKKLVSISFLTAMNHSTRARNFPGLFCEFYVPSTQCASYKMQEKSLIHCLFSWFFCFFVYAMAQ